VLADRAAALLTAFFGERRTADPPLEVDLAVDSPAQA
jgi:hypothetical protein